MKTGSASPTDPNLLMSALVLVGGVTLILLIFLTQPRNMQPASVSTAVLSEAAISAGRTLFLTVCAACHGPRATGIQGLGKPLVGSAFFNNRTDEEVLAFLQVGRPVDDPLNTTGIPMPARGGRLNLTDSDLLNVIIYLRSLNGAATNQ